MNRPPNPNKIRREAIRFIRTLLKNPSLQWQVEYPADVVIDRDSPQLTAENSSGQIVISYWPK